MTPGVEARAQSDRDLYAVPLPPEPSEPDVPEAAPREASVSRQLPSAPDAEQAVLGALMLAGRGAQNTRLRPADFYVPKHSLIFDAILRLAEAGAPIDPAAVVGALVNAGEIGRAGGAEYIHTLMSVAPLSLEIEYHAEQIREKAAARNQVATGVRIQQIGYQPDLTAAERAELTQKLAAELDPVRVAAPSVWLDVMTETVEFVEDVSKHPNGMRGIPTGLPDLDRVLRGLRDGCLYTFAGRPGMGKTTALTGLVRAAALKRGLPTALFSLEMNRAELGIAILSAELGIPKSNLETGSLTDREWDRLAAAMGEDGAPLFIEDSPGQSLADIRATARAMHRQGGLRLLVVDHIGLVATPGRQESRQQAVAELSRGFKLLAKELQIPVVIAAQLNRGNEQRTDKRPHLSDLRESGSIEQDSDVVVFVHRDDYYDRQKRTGEADLIVAKNRHGETRTVTVVAQLHVSRFMSSELHL